jgi:hypothetical protein
VAKEPEPEQCVGNICASIEDYCNHMKCPSSKPLDNVEAVLMIFFRADSKVRIHMVGDVTVEKLAVACAMAVVEGTQRHEGEIQDYAA